MPKVGLNFLRGVGPKKPLDEFVSEHYTWGDLLLDDVAQRDPALHAAQVSPPDEVFENLRFVANEVLEPLTACVGKLLVSGYKSRGLNAKIGGLKNSPMTKGWGVEVRFRTEADMEDTVARHSVSTMCDGKNRQVNANWRLGLWLMDNIERFPLEAMVLEYGDSGKPAWIGLHAHSNPERQRRRVLGIGSWTGGDLAALHRVDLINLGVR